MATPRWQKSCTTSWTWRLRSPIKVVGVRLQVPWRHGGLEVGRRAAEAEFWHLGQLFKAAV